MIGALETEFRQQCGSQLTMMSGSVPLPSAIVQSYLEALPDNRSVDMVLQRLNGDTPQDDWQFQPEDIPIMAGARVDFHAICHECERERLLSDLYELEAYDDPWQQMPNTIYVCRTAPDSMHGIENRYRESCLDYLTDEGWADFRYFTCDVCGRLVISQCPSNGWHSYKRIVNECQEVCLRCYEENLLANGVPRESFESGQLPGMFFSYGNTELVNAGFECIIDDMHVDSQHDALAVCHRALELIDSGHIVIVAYERMAIGGLEGYVSLYAKTRESEVN